MSWRGASLCAAGTIGLLCGTSCLQHRYDPLDADLGRAIVYAEHHGAGEEDWTIHSLRNGGPSPAQVRPTGPADRIPSPALIDIDGKLHVFVEKQFVGLGTEEHGLREAFASVQATREQFEDLLNKVEIVTFERQAALQAYRADAANFTAFKRQFGAAEESLTDQLLEHPRSDEIEDAIESAESTYDGLHDWFTHEVALLNQSYRELEMAVEAECVTLRLEAWLHGGGQQTPVHVPDYDTLEEGRIRMSDRWGLDLSQAERQRLEDELAATIAAAQRANQVLDGEKKLVEALAETLALPLAEAVERIDALVSQYGQGQLRTRLNELREESSSFWDEVELRADALTGQAKEDLAQLPSEFEVWMKHEATVVQAILDLLNVFHRLRDRWSDLTFAEFPTVLAETVNAVQRLESVSWPALVEDAATAAREFLDQQALDFEAGATTALAELRASPAGQEFLASVQEFYGDLQQAIQEVSSIHSGLVDVVQTASGAGSTLVTVPNVLQVPIDQLKDTQIDLRKTDRLSGDHLTIRATRTRDGEKIDQTTAEFQVRRFGWYAELSPAVVLVKPRNLASGNDGYRFAPTLSWLHHYVPRPGESGAWINSLQPALGIHAAFLNFDTGTSDSVQIGLGGTVALWSGRLQAGFGYNLMADQNNEGRVYSFVGTDLIGLLQSTGLLR